MTLLTLSRDKHNVGCATILQARGPDNFESDQSYFLFAGLRHMIIVNSMRSRKKTFLSDPDWLQKPWANRPKDIHQALLDIGAKLPTVLEEFDMVKFGTCIPVERRELCRRLISQSWQLDAELHTWYSSLCRKTCPESLQRIENGIPEDFEPANIALASSIVQYWCISICAYNTLRLAHEWISAEFPDMIFMQDLPEYVNPHHYAVAISRSTRYFFSEPVGAIGPWAFCVPMGFALAYFDFYCPEAKSEAVELLNGFKTDMGKVVRKFLLSAQARTSPLNLNGLVASRLINLVDGWQNGETHFPCLPGRLKSWERLHEDPVG